MEDNQKKKWSIIIIFLCWMAIMAVVFFGIGKYYYDNKYDSDEEEGTLTKITTKVGEGYTGYKYYILEYKFKYDDNKYCTSYDGNDPYLSKKEALKSAKYKIGNKYSLLIESNGFCDVKKDYTSRKSIIVLFSLSGGFAAMFIIFITVLIIYKCKQIKKVNGEKIPLKREFPANCDL